MAKVGYMNNELIYKGIILLVLHFLIYSTSCTNSSIEINSNNETKKLLTSNKDCIDSFSNSFARLVAGVEFDDKYVSSDFKSIWKKHSDSVIIDYQSLQNRTLNKIDSFVKTNLDIAYNNDIFVFYPFSGPDYLFADHFYQNHKSIVLVGMEPVGSIPNLNELSSTQFKNYLEILRNSLFTVHRYGFYLTQGMEDSFSDNLMNGTIHHLLYYLGIKNHRICYVETFTHNSAGDRIPVKQDNQVRSVYIEYFDSTTNSIRDISYYQMDLSNIGFTKSIWSLLNPNKLDQIKSTFGHYNINELLEFYKNYKVPQGFLAFIEKQSPFYLFIKSGSYTLHSEIFSHIRDIVINNSVCIIQDDSGIPFKYLNDGKWEIELYGDYSQTFALTDPYYQDNLADAYNNLQEKQSLPFNIGYMITKIEYNLIFCKKNDF